MSEASIAEVVKKTCYYYLEMAQVVESVVAVAKVVKKVLQIPMFHQYTEHS